MAKDKTEMLALRLTFKILTVCGCWRPKSWSSPCKTKLYDLYVIFMITLLHTVSLPQLLDVILNLRTMDDLTDNFYMMLSMMIASCKMISLLINRRNIMYLSSALEKEPFRASDKEEIDIQNRFEKVIRSNTLYYAILLEFTAGCIAVTAFIVDFKKKKLAFRAWLPFNYTSSTVFPFVFVHQLMGNSAGAFLHVASDSLICGLLMETCCQFEILESRLKRITNDNDGRLSKCIRHHNQIYQYARMINETFKVIICIQFVVSTLVVCFNLCQLVKLKTLSGKFLQLVSYMSCILTQIFLYCWCGNEVKLKSLQVSNMIFATNWIPLNVDDQRILIMIMRRATIPMEFTTAHIITMNLDSFANLLKTSYTVYNLLQQTQQY